ncbi:MAG TPA: Na+/H+ antiporter subunit D [Kiritimatiellia bacterium]|nr:Na+/H+ antiporter subunit D [Kiritimatiellia bacterium]HMP33059.1 Na+/H+ antiporter subunit D [Kiritimatiellia bacterium]
MNAWLIAPVALPLFAAILSLALRTRVRFQRIVSVCANAAALSIALALFNAVRTDGVLVLQLGSWPAPFGITFVADLFSAIMLVLSGLMGLAVAVYGLATMDEARERHGYHMLFHVLMMGVNGAFLTGDLFNLYVWFEVMLMASFVLLSLGGERAQLEGAIKYVALNFLSSALFLAGVGILYGISGTLNMADLSQVLAQPAHQGIINMISMLFLVAFGIKAALFPLFFWLPASYHTPPHPVSAIFAGLLTKVGVYALIRVFTLVFRQDVAFTHQIILILAAFTMVTGVLGAAAQMDIRRILSFHIVSQIGYMVMGLGLFTELALAGSVFYIMHHIIVKTNLFLVAGVVQRLAGSNELKKIGGVYRAAPWLAVLFLVPALSLAGIPPLSGFFAKLTLIVDALRGGSWAMAAVALSVGLLTLFSMTKIWNEVFWKPAPEGKPTLPLAAIPVRERIALLLPIIVLATCTVCIGLGSGWMFDLARQTAEQLLDPRDYVTAVLGVTEAP